MIILKLKNSHPDKSVPFNETNRRRIKRIIQKRNPQRLNVSFKAHTLEDLKNFLLTPKATASLKYNSSTTNCFLSTGIDTFDIRDYKKKKL